MHDTISVEPKGGQNIANEIVSEESSNTKKSDFTYVVALVEFGKKVVWVRWFLLSTKPQNFRYQVVRFVKESR